MRRLGFPVMYLVKTIALGLGLRLQFASPRRVNCNTFSGLGLHLRATMPPLSEAQGLAQILYRKLRS